MVNCLRAIESIAHNTGKSIYWRQMVSKAVITNLLISKSYDHTSLRFLSTLMILS